MRAEQPTHGRKAIGLAVSAASPAHAGGETAAAIAGGLAHNEETDQRYHRLWRVAVGNRHPDSCRAATSVAIANHGTRINYAGTGAKSRRRASACSAAAIADTARRSS